MRQISNLGPYQTDYFGVDERGRDGLYKINRQSDNASEVIASHLLVDELGQLGAIADEAVKTENGEQGVCTDFLPEHRKLKDAGLEVVPEVEARFVEAIIYQHDSFRKYDIYKDDIF